MKDPVNEKRPPRLALYGGAFDPVHCAHLRVARYALEQAQLDASDQRLLASPLGLGGLRCMGTLIFACGSELTRDRREALLAAAREALKRAVDQEPTIVEVYSISGDWDYMLHLVVRDIADHVWRLDAGPETPFVR